MTPKIKLSKIFSTIFFIDDTNIVGATKNYKKNQRNESEEKQMSNGIMVKETKRNKVTVKGALGTIAKLAVAVIAGAYAYTECWFEAWYVQIAIVTAVTTATYLILSRPAFSTKVFTTVASGIVMYVCEGDLMTGILTSALMGALLFVQIRGRSVMEHVAESIVVKVICMMAVTVFLIMVLGCNAFAASVTAAILIVSWIASKIFVRPDLD